MAQFEVTWIAPEFEYREKGVSWYWISIIVAACIVTFAVIERDFIFGFFIVVAEVLVIMWANQEPRLIPFELTENGITIGVGDGRFHALKEFESWSVLHLDDENAELGFNFAARLKTPLKILAPTEKIDDIRRHLKPVLREVEHQMSLIEAIERLLKF